MSKVISQASESNNAFTCETCSKTFATQRYLKQIYVCFQNLKRDAFYKRYLTRHTKAMHQRPTTAAAVKHSCTLCGKVNIFHNLVKFLKIW
jgi:ribosomal protein L37AE/L43A